MKIATFNANSIRARMDTILAWLHEHDPDVLCIQETKVVDEDFPADAFTDKGYHVVFRGQKSYNGVALISRQRPTAVRHGFVDDGPPDETRLLSAKVGGMHIVNTYIPQGRDIEHEMFQYKLKWYRRLRNHFDRHYTKRSRLVWVGDMNIAPTPIDVHNPEQQKKHVCFCDACREAFEATLAWGFVDVFRRHHPEPGQYSFFDYRSPSAVKEGRGWRIDHVLATPVLARKSVDAYIDVAPRLKPKASDHTFVAAEFDI